MIVPGNDGKNGKVADGWRGWLVAANGILAAANALIWASLTTDPVDGPPVIGFPVSCN